MDLYCDVIETIESKEGLTWIYIKDNHIKDTVFWTWEQLYKCVISK